MMVAKLIFYGGPDKIQARNEQVMRCGGGYV
jgi:hypothetical protein